MDPEIVTTEDIHLVGVECPEAGAKPYLIMNAWFALCARIAAVADPVEPHILYGAWHRAPGAAEGPGYLVGVRVPAGAAAPPGLDTLTIPAGRCVRLGHGGGMHAISQGYDRIMRWMRETEATHREGPTFEVYDTRQPIADAYAVDIYEPIA